MFQNRHDARILLQVEENYSLESLKRAHRMRVLEWHPDRLDSMAPELRAFANERLSEINAAYDFLVKNVGVVEERAGRTENASAESHWQEPEVSEPTRNAEQVDYESEISPDNSQNVVIRYLKAFLRTIWRVFITLTIFSFGFVFLALLLLGLIAKLSDYWNDKNKGERGDLLAYLRQSERLLALSIWTGLPIFALEGLFLVATLIVMCLGFVAVEAGHGLSILFSSHTGISAFIASAVLVLFFLWTLRKEYQIEFRDRLPRQKGDLPQLREPSTGAWVGGLFVLLIAGAIYFNLDDRKTNTSMISAVASPNQVFGSSSTTGVASGAAPIKEFAESSDKSPHVMEGPEPDRMREELTGILFKWRDAILANDPDREITFYAHNVGRYFLQTDLDREFVYQYLVQAKELGSSASLLNFSDISITEGPDMTYRVRFKEDFVLFQAGTESSGSVKTELHFVKEDGEWLINYERQFKI